MTYNADTRTITGATATFSISDVSRAVIFYVGEAAYFGTIQAYISADAVLLELVGTLPTVTSTIDSVEVITPDTYAPESGQYCASSDLEAVIGRETLAQLTNDTPGTSVPDAVVVGALITKACSIINNTLSGRYVVPLSPTPDIIKTIAVDLACYYAMLRRFTMLKMPDEWKDAYKFCADSLEKLANGDNDLGAGYAVAAADAQIVANDPVVDFNDAGNKFSAFI